MNNYIFYEENDIPFNDLYFYENSKVNNVSKNIFPENSESINSNISRFFENNKYKAFNNGLNENTLDSINKQNTISNENEEGESITEEQLYFVTENGKNRTVESTKLNEENNINKNEQMTSTDYFKMIFLKKLKKTCDNKENMGRKRKDEITDKGNENVHHDKYALDNIRLKYKRSFLSYLITFINLLIGNSNKLKNKGKIQKIDNCFVKNSKKEYILKMLDMSAKDYLSLPITKKSQKLDRDYNEKLIKYIYEVNEITVIEVLNKSIRELMNIFCSNIIQDNIFKHFKRLKDYIDNELSKEDQLYIEKFKYQALYYEDEYKEIKGRSEGLQ